jgi:hypothetical protein
LKKKGDDRISQMTLGDFVQAKKLGAFEEHDLLNDPTFIRYKIQKNPSLIQ